MIKIFNPGCSDWPEICQRPTQDSAEIEKICYPIFREVKTLGDSAIRKYTLKFDGLELKDLEVASDAFELAADKISAELKSAIKRAYKNIYGFHLAQRSDKVEVETTEGVLCWQEKRPIDKVGLYIPGGTAPLFSTVLMLAIPAVIAGCREIILCTPPDQDGNVPASILYTAQLCGVKRIFKVGGIQAIAAMTFGTESIPRVYKIFGPGNQYVTGAKQLSTRYNTAIDMPAGPSELLVMADSTADPAFVASDLLSQAEHGPDSQVIMVTTDEEMIAKVEAEVLEQIERLPRKTIAQQSITNSKLIFLADKKEAAEFINQYAPEHYILCSEDEAYFLGELRNAGSVFVGPYTPESAGDYASGTNHTLPTQGYAKQYNGVNLDSFLKSITFQKITETGLRNIGPTIEVMAEAEGLIGHKNAVSLRLDQLKSNKSSS
ncbi:MAG: histidinol dehydrogenase [Flavobacteriaceae bacterium]